MESLDDEEQEALKRCVKLLASKGDREVREHIMRQLELLERVKPRKGGGGTPKKAMGG